MLGCEAMLVSKGITDGAEQLYWWELEERDGRASRIKKLRAEIGKYDFAESEFGSFSLQKVWFIQTANTDANNTIHVLDKGKRYTASIILHYNQSATQVWWFTVSVGEDGKLQLSDPRKGFRVE